MKRIFLAVIVLLIISCKSEEPNFTVTGKVVGLKKGTLYLERLKDTLLIPIDSMLVNGEPEFVLQGKVEEPEVLHISLKTTNKEPDRISFFATEGTTKITTSLKRFSYDANIEGSAQQKLLDNFNETVNKFNDQSLELVKAQFDYRNDSLKLDSINRLADNILKRKYLYAINFALTNKSSEVAPYIALSAVYDANIRYLDTIFNSLPENIAKSKYGKELEVYIQERKSQE